MNSPSMFHSGPEPTGLEGTKETREVVMACILTLMEEINVLLDLITPEPRIKSTINDLAVCPKPLTEEERKEFDKALEEGIRIIVKK